MKKIQMLLLAVLIIGAASAFTTAVSSDPYVIVDGTFVLKSSVPGDCFETGEACTYEMVANPTPPIYTNRDNFIALDQDLHWESLGK
jgi:hypothetical protein